jgi:hypothetical protein
LKGLGTALTAALVVTAWTTPGRASAQGVSGGIRADLVAASFQNADFETDPRLGVRVGIYGDLELSGALGIRAEAVYAMKGVQNAESSSNVTVQLDYLEVPVMIKLAAGSGSGFFVMAGPAVGLKLSSKLSSDAGSIDYGDLVHPVDLGVAAGLGLDASLADRRVTFDIRYTYGLRSVFDFGDPSDTDSDDKNQVLAAGVGIGLF